MLNEHVFLVFIYSENFYGWLGRTPSVVQVCVQRSDDMTVNPLPPAFLPYSSPATVYLLQRFKSCSLTITSLPAPSNAVRQLVRSRPSRAIMYSYGQLKGWQAVPAVIPAFLIISVATIWYFSFHHFKNQSQYMNFTSTINSTSHRSGISDSGTGSRPSNHHSGIIDVPPVPAPAYTSERQSNAQAS
jgi:hypothetical protein